MDNLIVLIKLKDVSKQVTSIASSSSASVVFPSLSNVDPQVSVLKQLKGGKDHVWSPEQTRTTLLFW